MVMTLGSFALKKSKSDSVDLNAKLEKATSSLIQIYLSENFAELVNLSSRYSQDNEEEMKKEITAETVKSLNP